jgi:hypothetical protein
LAFSSSSSIIPDRSAFICRNGCRGTKWFSLQILLRDPGNREEKNCSCLCYLHQLPSFVSK